jgi:hypothetical protein
MNREAEVQKFMIVDLRRHFKKKFINYDRYLINEVLQSDEYSMEELVDRHWLDMKVELKKESKK